MRSAVAALVTAAVVSGCGGGGVPDSWVGAEEEYAIFLRWERSGDELTGSGVGVGVACDDSSPPRCTAQDEEPFTFRGAINGERVTLGWSSRRVSMSWLARSRANGLCYGQTTAESLFDFDPGHPMTTKLPLKRCARLRAGSLSGSPRAAQPPPPAPASRPWLGAGALHADLVMLARLSVALARARAIPLAA